LVIVVMGVVGAGKTTIGLLLAQKLGWKFADADDFHSLQNKNKISHGIPLTDADRAPWLAALRHAIEQCNAEGQNIILACSALKRGYRDELQTGNVQFVYLKGDYDLIASRLRARHGHFATESILKSQLADLEEPEDAIVVSSAKPPDAVVAEIIDKLKTAYPDATRK
jgi:gluconokinase